MPLTFASKSDIRRHLGYPVAGLPRISPVGGAAASYGAGNIGYRFFQAWGQLEYRLNNLNPDEEARLLGLAYAAFALTGPQPNVGDEITITLSGGPIGSPQELTATMPDGVPAAQDGRLILTAAIAAACAENGVLASAGVLSAQPYGTGPWAQNAVPIPECAFTCPSAFSIAGAGSGVTYPQITANGVMLGPSTSLDGVTTLWGYLAILDGLENAYATASQNLDTIRADVWQGRSTELAQRRSLYETWRGMLADYLGIPICQFKTANAARTGALRYV